MSKREKTFYIVYGMVFFPLLLLFLVLHEHLDSSLITPFLTFMVSMKAIYAGADGFKKWNETPNEVK